MSELILIVGVSTRALALSAVRAGYNCTTVDYFGDIDQKTFVRNVALAPDLGQAYSAEALVHVAARVQAGSVVYGGNFENHPDAVARLATDRELLGNAPDALRRVRDLRQLAHVPAGPGLVVPDTLPADQARSADPKRTWVRKPIRSGGGLGVAPWRPGEGLHSGEVVQEFVEGMPGSAAVVGDGRRAVVLGLSRQIIGRRAFGVSGFRYCGSLLPLTDNPEEFQTVVSQVRSAAETATAAFSLRGVFGIDFVVNDGGVHVLEVNPRYTASMELVERAYGISIFDAHMRACRDSALVSEPPHHQPVRTRTAYGKAILFAGRPVTLGDTRSWLQRGRRISDIPRPGATIDSGAPIFTFFAEARNPLACERLLERIARAEWASIIGHGGMNGADSPIGLNA